MKQNTGKTLGLQIIIAAAVATMGSCEKRSGEQSPDASGEQPGSPIVPSIDRQVSSRDSRERLPQKRSLSDAVGEFFAEMEGRWDDHDAARAEIEARLAELETDEDRMGFINLLVRKIPHDAYALRWELLEKHIENPELRTGLLGMVLGDSLPVATDWVLARIVESEDPELCRRGVNSVVNFLFDTIDPAKVPEWLGNAFQDGELFSMGIDLWLSELKSPASGVSNGHIYEQLLHDDRISAKIRSRVADSFFALPSEDTPLERAGLLMNLGITDGGWGAIIPAGARLSGDELNQFFDIIDRTSPYVRGDFFQAYLSNHDTATVIAELPNRNEAARQSILAYAAGNIFEEKLTAQLLTVIEDLPLAEQNRLADQLVFDAARRKIPAAEIEPILNLNGQSARRMDIYRAPREWKPEQ